MASQESLTDLAFQVAFAQLTYPTVSNGSRVN